MHYKGVQRGLNIYYFMQDTDKAKNPDFFKKRIMKIGQPKRILEGIKVLKMQGFRRILGAKTMVIKEDYLHMNGTNFDLLRRKLCTKSFVFSLIKVLDPSNLAECFSYYNSLKF